MDIGIGRIFSRGGSVGIGTDRFTKTGGGSVPSLEVRGATMVHGGSSKLVENQIL